MDIRETNKRYEEIAEKLVNTEDIFKYIKNSNVSICFLSSEHQKTNKGKLVLGQCEKVQDKYKWAIPYDFTITLFEPNIEDLTEEQVEAVIFHELLHVGIDKHESGEEIYYIVPHDLEDFKAVIERFGTNWAEPKGAI